MPCTSIVSVSSRKVRAEFMSGLPSFPDRPPSSRRNPGARHLDRHPARYRNLALRCRKFAPEEPGSHVAFKAMNVDEQRRVGATAAAREQL